MINFIYMPFGSLNHPSIALGQFRSQLGEASIPCRVHYFNFLLGSMMGFRNYELTSLQSGMGLQIAEGLFGCHAWGSGFGMDMEALLATGQGVDFSVYGQNYDVKWLIELRDELIPRFLDEGVRILMEESKGNFQGRHVFGFSCSYFQTLPSLALARRLKQKLPECVIVFGGSGFHSRMGLELLRSIPFADIVSTGEADDVVVPLFSALNEGRLIPDDLQGIHVKDALLFQSGSAAIPGAHFVGESYGRPSIPVSASVLEAIPTPDYQDYYNCLEMDGVDSETAMGSNYYLPFETSRGCWKGSRQHCAFCGLNPEDLAPRRKSPDRVMRIMRDLLEARPTDYVPSLHATDNLLPNEYFDDLLPRMAREGLPGNPRLFCEMRTTLSRNQVRLLAMAGFRAVQPGVESLSTEILKLMRKGVTGIKNIHFLILCQTYGIEPRWNMLYRIPGEEAHYYDEMASKISRLTHLTPPLVRARHIEMQPFSPMSTEAGWADSLSPQGWYGELYPADRVCIPLIAYFMEASLRNVISQEDYSRFESTVKIWVDLWRDQRTRPLLNWYADKDGDELLIQDTRTLTRTGSWQLDNAESMVYLSMSDPISMKRLHGEWGHLFENFQEFENTIRRFRNFGLIIEESGQYLALAIPGNTESLELLEKHLTRSRESNSESESESEKE
ncbi:MAG: hypothetical protein CVV64_04760 [Candidatus Wallbacteria bacterium HGW-Wallbacteria-1]|jgi:ribosomal peptide maturation radical SAM protein 1|uniref:Elp3/MiaA/NifB-like radical SAM core domain-containing protein n=1 Tax=Candidatus Wallbacteria bacterium HGW-Wallbacteria-1 TaxID=2013854 RepID=A0A2N1PRW8_9BACT|nr:MAG: hypothetical protein CVV64_04760 [Candidatus Wallbacteria bacterium HGW-Wallbacteria-1]